MEAVGLGGGLLCPGYVENREVMRLVVYYVNWWLKQSKYAGWNDALVVSMLRKR